MYKTMTTQERQNIKQALSRLHWQGILVKKWEKDKKFQPDTCKAPAVASSERSLQYNKKWKFKIFFGKMLQPIHSIQAIIMKSYWEYAYSEMITAVWEDTGAAGMQVSADKNYRWLPQYDYTGAGGIWLSLDKNHGWPQHYVSTVMMLACGCLQTKTTDDCSTMRV